MQRGLISFLILLLHTSVKYVYASGGDNSWVFNKCLRECLNSQCTQSNLEVFEKSKPIYMYFWSCSDECKYSCMWLTVDAYKKDNSGVPQFYGKWPFVRFLGIQEPASTLFSLLNGLPHIFLLLQFRRKVPNDSPMYYVTHWYALVGTIVWLCSTIFHTKDTRLTEALDYFGAIGYVLTQLFFFTARILGTRGPKIICSSLILLAFYCYHVHYMWFVSFDYGYNIKVNVFIGLVNSIGWLWFCWHNKKLKYVWKAAVVVLSLNLLVLLELLDFPPVLWTFDAHSLWHAGTIPLPFLWYRFLIDDCNYLRDKKIR